MFYIFTRIESLKLYLVMVSSKVCASVSCERRAPLPDIIYHPLFETDYYTSHPPFEKNSPIAIAAVGTTALAIQYGEVKKTW